jgi:putative DNA primase/helicase
MSQHLPLPIFHSCFSPSPQFQVAFQAVSADLSVVPISSDGSKRPALSRWKHFQQVRPGIEEIALWYPGAVSRLGLGLITGEVSGNLIALDFDDGEIFERWEKIALADPDVAPIYLAIANGYEEITPSGGRHFLLRCEVVARNQKLALRPGIRTSEIQTLIESREEGGLIIIAPSGGSVHPSGRPYLVVRGSLSTIHTITALQRQLLYASLRSMDEMPPLPVSALRMVSALPRSVPSLFQGERVGDRFNHSAQWEEILFPHGWTIARTLPGGEVHWRRPGKEGPGISATTNYQHSDLLYVFSTATLFEAGRGYTKFTAYTLLEHAGNFSHAAKTLARLGYASRQQLPLPANSLWQDLDGLPSLPVLARA